ncbi:hypothetical protein C357_13275 [Citreicella sp. 357]|nr:hypothetical protein C357_13275 [Citreicella sp. 357]
MTTDRTMPYAGLRLADGAGFDLGLALADAAAVLGDLDCASGKPVRRARKRAAVVADRFAVAIRAPCAQDKMPRALIRVIARDGVGPDDEAATAILARTVQLVLDHTDAARVEWCAPTMRLSRDGFRALHDRLTNNKCAPAPDERDEEQRLADSIRAAQEQADLMIAKEAEWRASRQIVSTVEAAVVTVRDRITEQPPEERRLSLTAWLMTGMIGLVHLPIAVMLGIIGSVRGVNYRSVTRVLTGVALVVACQSLGLFDTVMPALLR